MAEILLFTPKHERDCRKNLAEFVEMCRDRLTVFGEGLDWDADNWPPSQPLTSLTASSIHSLFLTILHGKRLLLNYRKFFTLP